MKFHTCVYVSAAMVALTCTNVATAGSGKNFDSKDWSLACDNTRTCRAAGYSHGNPNEHSVSLLLTRKAGEQERVHAKVRFLSLATASAPHLWIGKIDLGTIQQQSNQIWQLSDAQTQALIPALLGIGQSVRFSQGDHHYPLSSNGANSVLLKMDDWQGRINTPSALTRLGHSTNAVLPALAPAKVIYQKPAIQATWTVAAQSISRQQVRAELAQQYTPQLSKTCPNLVSKSGQNDNFQLHILPLSATNSVATGLCWQSGRNQGHGIWLINNQAPFQAMLVTTDANHYANGLITVSQKGDDAGTCGWHQTFAWDGKRFALADDKQTGLCRGFAGGAWSMPTWVSTYSPAH